MADWLDAHGLEYTRQARFKTCVAIRTLPFDFCVASQRTLIEYQGEQHYVPRTWGSSADPFETLAVTQKHDGIKRTWARANGWREIRIPYYDEQLDDRLGGLVKCTAFGKSAECSIDQLAAALTDKTVS